MISFTLKLEELFKMNRVHGTDVNFNQAKHKLVIPLYQREFKWEDDKINTLIQDVSERDKFLGIIILDERNDFYEIVDGQQRVTTCYLLLMALYNHYSDSPMEQSSLEQIIKPYNDFILKNESVGDYICTDDRKLVLNILDESDVYYQKERFDKCYELCETFVNNLPSDAKVNELKGKLLDSQFLIIINESHENTNPIEQVFLDINEKSQLLEPEDIFKGHCFENFQENFYDQLRGLWVDLKKCGMRFKRIFYYNDLSQYIYSFLLENESLELSEKLTISGKHYLEGMNMDRTKACLDSLIKYGNSVLNFFENINKVDYEFGDLCIDSGDYRNTTNYQVMKKMANAILATSNAQYQKLPLMQFIYEVTNDSDLRNVIRFKELRSIISNLYIYSSIFSNSTSRKSKKSIDITIRDALRRKDIALIKNNAKSLRNQSVQNFEIKENKSFEYLSFVYSIIDNYIANDNYVRTIYEQSSGYNKEHFIIPDNSSRRIKWKNGEIVIELFCLPNQKKYKKYFNNFLIMDEVLNGNMEDFDVITKIEMIKAWYVNHNEAIPNHIQIFISFCENMTEYQALKSLKENGGSNTEIESTYHQFIEAYFNEDNLSFIKSKILEKFRESFQNL